MSDIQKAAKSVENFLKHFKDLGDVLKEVADFERLHAERNMQAGNAHKALLEANKKVSDAQEQLDAIRDKIVSTEESLADVEQKADGIIRAAQEDADRLAKEAAEERAQKADEFNRITQKYVKVAEDKKAKAEADAQDIYDQLAASKNELKSLNAELDALKSKFA